MIAQKRTLLQQLRANVYTLREDPTIRDEDRAFGIYRHGRLLLCVRGLATAKAVIAELKLSDGANYSHSAYRQGPGWIEERVS